ncbi:hypothetical protein KAM576c_37060 [Enterobacter asburiae]|jgi:hypothetical protein|nr:hypothetical protein EAA2563_35170 [Enterobacter asburiae]BCP71484.1 hypothetical protein R1N_36710 [Enterobacter asburiae]BDS27087.1 hypothetical protein KAM576c_37060 [Enterobacter asburiae]
MTSLSPWERAGVRGSNRTIPLNRTIHHPTIPQLSQSLAIMVSGKIITQLTIPETNDKNNSRA